MLTSSSMCHGIRIVSPSCVVTIVKVLPISPAFEMSALVSTWSMSGSVGVLIGRCSICRLVRRKSFSLRADDVSGFSTLMPL